MYVYNAAWLALGLVLSAVLAVAAVVALRKRGVRPALFLAGLALLPMAGYLTGTLRLFGVIADQLAGYVVGFAFSPKVWLGVILGGVGVVLMATASAMKRRGIAAPTRGRRGTESPGATAPRSKPSTALGAGAANTGGTGGTGNSGDMDDIEAILRKHGIS